jgi:exopolysaccharide biosynthesis protein
MLGLGATSGPLSTATSPPTTIKTLLCTPEADRVTLEADYDGSATPFIYMNQDRGTLNVDLNDVDADTLLPPALLHDDLVAGSHVDHPTFRRAIWVINLRYPVPGENLTMQRSPGKLVIQILRHVAHQEASALATGVDWGRSDLWNDGRMLTVNQLVVHPQDKAVHLDVALANDPNRRTQPTSTQVTSQGALAGVNGGFFESHQGPLGLIVSHGKLVSPPVDYRPPRTTLGINPDGSIVMDQVKLDHDRLVGVHGTDWSKVETALGGGPRLIRDGHVEITAEEEGFGSSGNDITYRAARTAVALLPDHTLLIVTVRPSAEGERFGLRFAELAAYLEGLHATDAMCLDGGGSTAMAVGQNLVDHVPGARDERPVADTLLVFDKAPAQYPNRLDLTLDHLTAPADGTTVVSGDAHVYTASGQPVPDGTDVAFSTSLGAPLGTVKTQNGVAHVSFTAPPIPLAAEIRARCGIAQGYAMVHYTLGPAAHLYARAVQSPGSVLGNALTTATSPSTDATPSPSPSEPIYTVDVLVTDTVGNPLVAEPITADFNQTTGRQYFTRLSDTNGTITVAGLGQPGGLHMTFSNPTAGSLSLTLSP